MLMLSRKPGESVDLDFDVAHLLTQAGIRLDPRQPLPPLKLSVTLVRIGAGCAKLGFDAPRIVNIARRELLTPPASDSAAA